MKQVPLCFSLDICEMRMIMISISKSILLYIKRASTNKVFRTLPRTWASPVAQLVKKLPANQETWIRSLGGQEDSLEEGTAAAAAKSLQSCPTLCDPIEGSPPGSPVPGILQARVLEWVAISFSNA